MIDRSGKWWTGTEAGDIEEYLRSYTEDGYPADRFAQAVCGCGKAVFRLETNDVEGVARRGCVDCGLAHFVCDSDEFASDATLAPVKCPCGGDQFDITVGFSHRAEETIVRWISVGVRCVRCGVLGCPVEWEIDYAPTAQLYDQA